jgi:hypothetical protein
LIEKEIKLISTDAELGEAWYASLINSKKTSIKKDKMKLRSETAMEQDQLKYTMEETSEAKDQRS